VRGSGRDGGGSVGGRVRERGREEEVQPFNV
jgi:hypothetical protein